MYHRNFPQLKPPSTETDPTKDVISKSTFPFAKKKKKNKKERESQQVGISLEMIQLKLFKETMVWNKCVPLDRNRAIFLVFCKTE